jgi:transcriptional regulator with PAS, ATPase and Fis domain
MKEVKEMAKSIASTESPVMIRGESGTGKELFARAIHYSSSRRTKPFIPINCGAIPDNLLESELFGYEKGAFTGANASKPGKFEIADGGTVFLDEIGELPPRLQVKLLRIIQEKEICRLGSNTTRMINVRILSATNADLEQRIRDGLFREDLYYRLNIFPIHIPPLREHKEDIEYLANYFLHYYNGQFEKEIKGLSEEVRKMFLSYTWPGNVRELQSVMEFAVCLETKDLLSGPLIHRRLNREINMGFRAESAAEYSLKGEKQVFLSLIKKYRDLSYKDMEKSICAELGISRATYYRKKKKYQAE